MASLIITKTMLELQKTMEQHGKEIAETLKSFQDVGKSFSQSLTSLGQFGIDVSKTLEKYKSISTEAAISLKPVYDLMESIQANMAWIKNIETSSFNIGIKNLEELQGKIIDIPEVFRPININPSLLVSPIRDDRRLKNLIKEAIQELGEEEARIKKQEFEELAKKNKIGFEK
ncbi:MAG: hypothetical protein WC543_05980 [Candidatus Omnitrophota bacterium]